MLCLTIAWSHYICELFRLLYEFEQASRALGVIQGNRTDEHSLAYGNTICIWTGGRWRRVAVRSMGIQFRINKTSSEFTQLCVGLVHKLRMVSC